MKPKTWKEWERSIHELEEPVAKLREVAASTTGPRKAEIEAKIDGYQKTLDKAIKALYRDLSAWEKVLVARAEPRPYTLDYINLMFTDFVELTGDRRHGADHAIVGGPAYFGDQACFVIGHQKGRNIHERKHRNFAMAKPEGYRTAIRLMEMASRFGLPVITFVDTPAADPGVESEGRGISEAIAASMLAMFEVKTPIVSVVIGEGGSGGAIGIAAANKVLMLEHAVYSVIPPEGCAAILWRRPEMGPEASDALKLTAQSALELGIIDGILPEPIGGAHRDVQATAETIEAAIRTELTALLKLSSSELRKQRYDKFRALGKFETAIASAAVSL